VPSKTSPDLKADLPTYAVDFVKSDVDNVTFYDNPIIDNIVTTILALGSEIWSSQRRTMVLERLLEQKGVTREMVEGYMPTEEDVAEWQAERDRFVDRTMSHLMREGGLPPSADWPKKD